jgi:hypothetical protein
MRHLRLATSVLAFGSIFTIGALASASPVDEVRRGTTLFLRNAYGTVEGHPQATDYVPLPKAAGTLDVVLDARALGIDYDAIFHLTGTAEGDRITWTFDEIPATPWDLGSNVRVSRVRGKLIGRVRWLFGSTSIDCGGLTPCNYSVQIESLPGTTVEITGSAPIPWFPLVTEGFVKSVADPSFALYAGLPMPSLASFDLAVPHDRFCTGSVERRYSGRVALEYASTHGGVWVDLFSSDPGRLNERRVYIREGETSARFTARFPADYSGTVLFRAAAGGVMFGTSVDIAPCMPMLDREYARVSLIEELFGCAACASQISINDRGNGVANVNGAWQASASGAVVDIAKLLKTEVEWATIDPLGDLIARAKNASGEYVGVRVRDFTDDLSGKVEWASAISPTYGHEAGLMLGSCKQGPCLWNGGSIVPLAFDAKGRVADLTHSGVILANAPVGNSTRAFWVQRDESGQLGSLGGHTEVAAVNESGDGVGFSDTSSGQRLPVVFSAVDWSKPKALALPAGAKSGVATGIAEDGTIVGNATLLDGKSRAFVLLPGAQSAVFLDTRVSESGLVIRDAQSITPSGAILASGERNGKLETFVLLSK